jgi:hypothetical protein
MDAMMLLDLVETIGSPDTDSGLYKCLHDVDDTGSLVLVSSNQWLSLPNSREIRGG